MRKLQERKKEKGNKETGSYTTQQIDLQCVWRVQNKSDTHNYLYNSTEMREAMIISYILTALCILSVTIHASRCSING